MRIATCVAAAASVTALLTLTACSNGSDSDNGSGAVPHYTVLKKTWSPAKLLVEDPTKASATAAVEDWLSTNAGDRRAWLVDVYRSKNDAHYVCRGEYYADAKTAEVLTEGKAEADSWPHTFVTCPGLDS
ncbi:hypothetical protein GCM10010129_54120 [Streptomyces fumigatiscleroticus]|nr:hypothetical protein GCM10010129_54120 [Streptomyces fumigatiscleroticus]